MLLFLFPVMTSCSAAPEQPAPEINVAPGKNIPGIRVLTDDGGHLSWSKKINKIAFDRLGSDGHFDFWIINRNGVLKKRLTWFHSTNHPHFLDREFAVAADFDWSPDGSQLAALVITNRPDTRKRGSGIIVLINLP